MPPCGQNLWALNCSQHEKASITVTTAKQESPSRLNEEKRLYRAEALEYQTTRFLGRPVNFHSCCKQATIASYAAFLVVVALALTLKYEPRVEGELSTSADGSRYVVRVVKSEQLASLRAGDEVYLQLASMHSRPKLLVNSVDVEGKLIEGHVHDGTRLLGANSTTSAVAVLLPRRRLFFR